MLLCILIRLSIAIWILKLTCISNSPLTLKYVTLSLALHRGPQGTPLKRFETISPTDRPVRAPLLITFIASVSKGCHMRGIASRPYRHSLVHDRLRSVCVTSAWGRARALPHEVSPRGGVPIAEPSLLRELRASQPLTLRCCFGFLVPSLVVFVISPGMCAMAPTAIPVLLVRAMHAHGHGEFVFVVLLLAMLKLLLLLQLLLLSLIVLRIGALGHVVHGWGNHDSKMCAFTQKSAVANSNHIAWNNFRRCNSCRCQRAPRMRRREPSKEIGWLRPRSCPR